MDNDETVRAVAAKGCGQVLCDLWQVIPSHHQAHLLTMLCSELTHDMRCSDVVVSALQVGSVGN